MIVDAYKQKNLRKHLTFKVITMFRMSAGLFRRSTILLPRFMELREEPEGKSIYSQAIMPADGSNGATSSPWISVGGANLQAAYRKVSL